MELRLHAGAKDVALYFVHWLTDLAESSEKSEPSALPSCLWRSFGMVSLTYAYRSSCVYRTWKLCRQNTKPGNHSYPRKLIETRSFGFCFPSGCHWNLGWS